MIIREDVFSEATKKLINDAININGYASEHNYDEFVSYAGKDSKPVYADFGNNKGILAIDYGDVWSVYSEIIAPEEERSSMFIEFALFLFNKNVKKIMIECSFEFRKELLAKTKGFDKIIIGNVVEHYFTPIISLDQWDPMLIGSDFSNLRKVKNRFFRNFKVEIVMNHDIKNQSIDEIKSMILAWKKNRKAKDRALHDSYINFAANGYKANITLLLKLNGVVKGLASAIVVPNNPDTVYFNINLHDYSIPELGDFLTVIFFDKLKSEGYRFINFGSSDENLLKYKKKFNPIKVYDSAFFYVRNNVKV